MQTDTTTPQSPSEKQEQDVEKRNLADAPPLGTVVAPQPAPDVADDIDDDELFPENLRAWLVVLGCFMLSS
jgi:hypothetical protein